MRPLRPKLLLRRLLAEAGYRTGLLGLVSDNSWRILMYHRIVDPEQLPYPIQPGMYVRPETFRLQLRYLSRSCNLLPLEELANLLAERKTPPPRSIAVTFDDGWRDNYTAAFPLLKEFAVPATIFLATHFLDSAAPFWTDIAGMFIAALERPGAGSAESAARMLEPAERGEFLGTLGDLDGLMAFLTRLRPAKRSKLLAAMTEFSAGRGITAAQPFLSWSEAQEMAAAGFAFGSHTHRHSNLREYPLEEVAAEVDLSLRAIRARGINPSTVFCYPGGAYSSATQAVLRKFGVRFVLTTRRASTLNTSPMLLSRVGIHQDVASSTAAFAARIWLNKLL